MQYRTQYSRLRYYAKIFLKPASIRQGAAALARKAAHAFSGRSRPQTLELGLTYRCQLACEHCGVAGLHDAARTEMSFGRFAGVIDEAAALGVYLLICGGGEPLLSEHLDAVVTHARRRGMLVGISTNGGTLTPARAVSLRRQGLVFANVSVDSPDAQTHNRNRGNDRSFQQAVAAVEACVSAGISAIVSTCMTKDMIAQKKVPAMITFARRIGAHGIRLLFPVPAGKWYGCEAGSISAQDREEVKALLDPEYVYVEGVCNTFTECNAARKKFLYVSPYGDVQPCSFVPLSFGTLNAEPLGVIWQRAIAHPLYRQANSQDCMMRDAVVRSYIDGSASTPGAYPVLLKGEAAPRLACARGTHHS